MAYPTTSDHPQYGNPNPDPPKIPITGHIVEWVTPDPEEKNEADK